MRSNRTDEKENILYLELFRNANNGADFMRAVYEKIKITRPQFSLRAWAQKLEMSPGTLSRILKGERGMPKKLMTRMPEHLMLTPELTAYFELLELGSQSVSPASFRILRRALEDQITKNLRKSEELE